MLKVKINKNAYYSRFFRNLWFVNLLADKKKRTQRGGKEALVHKHVSHKIKVKTNFTKIIKISDKNNFF